MDKNFDATLSGALHTAADAAHAADASGARTRGRQRAMRKRIVMSTVPMVLAVTGVAGGFAATGRPHGAPTAPAVGPSATVTSAPATPAATTPATQPATTPATTPATHSATTPATQPASQGPSTSQDSSHAPGPGVSACGNGDLLVWEGPGRIVGSHTGTFLVVTNESGHACTVQGYLTVVIASRTATLERATPVLNGYLGDGGPSLTGAPQITLASKASAMAMLENNPDGANNCLSSGTGGLQVTAPGSSTASHPGGPYPISVSACPDLEINPLVADPDAGTPVG